jgi:hypothetical protein
LIKILRRNRGILFFSKIIYHYLMKKLFLSISLFALALVMAPFVSRAALLPTGQNVLTGTNRPYFRITEAGDVAILGARLMGASKDYLGIQIFGINQNIMVNGSTTLTVGGRVSPLTAAATGQGGEIDIWGSVDPVTGNIMASNVRGVSLENDRQAMLQTQLHLLQIQLLHLLQAQMSTGGK